jgi:hypothetical protein
MADRRKGEGEEERKSGRVVQGWRSGFNRSQGAGGARAITRACYSLGTCLMRRCGRPGNSFRRFALPLPKTSARQEYEQGALAIVVAIDADVDERGAQKGRRNRLLYIPARTENHE